MKLPERLEDYNPVHLAIGPLASKISDLSGISSLSVEYVVVLVATALYSWTMRLWVHRVPRGVAHAFIFLLSFFLEFSIYHWMVFHYAALGLLVYAILSFLPASFSYIVGVIITYGYLLCSHLYIMHTAFLSWEPDFTAPLMVLTIKLFSLCFCFHDAWIADHPDSSSAPVTLTPRQQKYAVHKLPNLGVFLSWVYFCPGFFCGPAIELNDYIAYVDGSLFDDVPNPSSSSSSNGKRKVRIPHAFKLVTLDIIGIIVSLGTICTVGRYNTDLLRNELVEAEAAAKHPMWERIMYVTIAAWVLRCKYYLVWLLSELASISSGCGYSGMVPATTTSNSNGEEKALVPSWERSENIRMMIFERSASIHDTVSYWNMGTQRWLRYYAYDRLVGTPLEAHARIITFVSSALWHGVYPSYYFMFVQLGIYRELEAIVRRRIRKRLEIYDKEHPRWHTVMIYDEIQRIFIRLIVVNLCTTFSLLTFHDVYGVWKNLNFLFLYTLFIGIAACLIAVAFFPPLPRSDKKNTDSKKKKQ